MMTENRALALKPLRYVHVLASTVPSLFTTCFFEAERLTIVRLDAELALQTGLPTLFNRNATTLPHDVSSDSSFTMDQLPYISFKLSCIMLSVRSFARLLNGRRNDGQTKLDPLIYTETLVALLYRLIDFAPLGQPRSVSVGLYDDILHLAMLAFMTTLLVNYDGDESYNILSGRLESVIQNYDVKSADKPDSAFCLILWTLFVGGVSVLRRKNHQKLVLEICERLNLYDWPAVRCQLSEFPWIHTLHDVPGQCLWEDAKRRNMDIPREYLQLET